MKKAEHLPCGPILPRSVVNLLRAVDESQRHSGLQLEKLSPPGNQETQKQEIAKVCGATTAPDLLSALLERRATMLKAVRAERFRASTSGPLTLHLARASGLENAGIHLHPVYGFACLPGSGLKGMARAWAETVWLVDQENPVAAWSDIRAVFGWARRSEEGKRWKPEDTGEPEGSRTGSIVFHDAWPTGWPRLMPDIVNNHHKNYYKGEDDPGDWEMPEMAYFLSVAANTTFDFALSPRLASSSCESTYLTLAKEWLQSALVYEGAGAKTNAGYGRFRLEADGYPKFNGTARQISIHTLKLVTPAFLAGADQEREDSDLRPATIRGQLRWWWRTIHAAHLNHKDLLRLETAIWGDAKNGAALALSVHPENTVDPRKFDKSKIAKHLAIPSSQGIRYATYGMDETKRHQRWYIEPGMRWTLTLSARRGRISENGPLIEAADVLRHGQIALWLLCRYGGIGSKARNGFGSFSDIEVDAVGSVQDCKETGTRLREAVGLTDVLRNSSKSSNLDEMLVLEIPTQWRNHWLALDQLGCSMQSFARKNRHNERKAALGLPRKIHGPRKEPMKHQDPKQHQPPMPLGSESYRKRFAAPIHYHLASDAGTLILRLSAFPSPVLPDIKTSRAVLTELRDHLDSDLEERAQKHGNREKTRPTGHNPSSIAGNRSDADASLPKPGDRVDAFLLEERTKKGGWKAKHELTGLRGPLQNTSEVPDNALAGQRVPLIVAFANANQISFNWPTPEIEARRLKPSGKREQRGGRTKRPQRGRR